MTVASVLAVGTALTVATNDAAAASKAKKERIVVVSEVRSS